MKTNIKRLTKTFLTLSLEDVAARVGLNSPSEAERWLVIMIEEGSIHATISQKDGKGTFLMTSRTEGGGEGFCLFVAGGGGGVGRPQHDVTLRCTCCGFLSIVQ